jgi:hypothetical protein
MVTDKEGPRKKVPKVSRCIVRKDKGGTYYVAPKDGVEHPEVAMWWSRGKRVKVLGRTHMPEYLCIKQDNGEDRADVLLLSPGQVYDMLDALTQAVEKA